MTRRFTDTDRWKAFRKLSSSLKALYDYAWDMADSCGVYEYDAEYLMIDLKEKFTEEEFLKLPNLQKIAPGKFLFLNFIEVNYGQIKEGYNPHKPVFRDLEKNHLTLNDKKNQASFKLEVKLEEEGEYEEEYEEEEEKGGVGDFEVLEDPIELCPTFKEFWDAYDKKRGSPEKLKKKWAALTQKEREEAMEYIPDYKLSQPDKQFRKDPQTFLNNKSWKDEIIKSNGGQQGNNFKKPESAAGVYEMYRNQSGK